MRRLAVASSILLLAAFGPVSVSHSAVVYRSSEGWSVEGDPGSTIEGSAAEQMRKGESLESQGDLDSALSAYRGLVRRYGLSVLAPKAQRKIGAILERMRQFEKAYDAYDVYLTKYPNGTDFEEVVEAMFKIAQLYLEGEKKRVLGVPVAASMSRAQSMFEGITKRAPFSKYAPMAQFNTGQALEKQGKYPEAISAYQQVISKYSTDAVADDAQYQIGYVLLKEYREGSYDRAAAQKAREAFEDFVNRYPESEKVPQARENMKQLETGTTKGSLEIAKFYDKTKSFKAAVIYYNDVVKQQPDSPEAEFAKKRIDELKEKYGEDALRAGPERAETGARARARRKLQAKVDTISRPDYAGPPVVVPEPDVVAPSSRPKLRTSPADIGPVPPVEPPLPEALPQDTGLPQPAPPGKPDKSSDKPSDKPSAAPSSAQ